jgi:hypothetical protein
MQAFIQQTWMATSWQKTNKSDIVFLQTFLHNCSKCWRASLSCSCMGTSSKYGSPSYHILRWHPPCSYMLHTCQPSYYPPQRPQTPNHFWNVCTWTHLPSSSAIMLAHAFGTPQKSQSLAIRCPVAFVEIAPVNSTLTPHFTCPNAMAFQETTSQDGILLKTVEASSMLPHFLHKCQSSYCTQWIFVGTHSSGCLLRLPILHICCKLLISWKNV